MTCGEETPNDFDGAEYLVQNHHDLIDAEFALNEGAGGRMNSEGQRIYNGVQAGEKVYQDLPLRGHQPRRTFVAAGQRQRDLPARGGLTRLSTFQFPIQFNDATRGFFERMSKIETGQVAGRHARDPYDAAQRRSARSHPANPSYNSILHTTCVATMLDGGHAPNGLPQRAGANVNCRIFPGTTQEDVRLTLERVVDDPAIKVTFVDPPEKVSPPPPLTKPVLDPIAAITQKMWPGVPCADDGSRRNRRPLPDTGRHSNIRRQRHFRRSGNHERAWPERTGPSAVVIRGARVPRSVDPGLRRRALTRAQATGWPKRNQVTNVTFAPLRTPTPSRPDWPLDRFVGLRFRRSD